MNDEMNGERESFEVWCDKSRNLARAFGEPEQYASTMVQNDWEVWQARASHGQAPAQPVGAEDVRAVCDQVKGELAVLHDKFPETRPSPQAAQQAPSSYGSPELQAMIVARCVEKDMAQQAPAGATASGLQEQHDRDSRELRSLCESRDQARRERDELRALIDANRITAPAAPSTPSSFQGRVERHSDQSVLVVFPSCRLASEFERSLLPASPTIEGESK